MAMEALTNLTTKIPDWQKRLDDLSTQIDRRQVELAALAEGSPKEAEAKSLWNKGSTESLKPRDDGPLHICYPEGRHPHHESLPCQDGMIQPSPPSSVAEARMGLPKPIGTEVASHSQAGVQVRTRTASVAPADGPPTTYRTRNMIIVYYDSYVQGFFDDLVRFISSSRNLMRKAKTAAKIAQYLAKMLDDGNASGDDKDSTEALPSLGYIRSRCLARPRRKNQAPDVYDDLDKGLEFVQSTCEHGAHRFLRESSCRDEIKEIQQRLAEVLELAAKEMERVQREEPESAKDPRDMGKISGMSSTGVLSRMYDHLVPMDNSEELEVADSAAAKISTADIANRIGVDRNAQAVLSRIEAGHSRANPSG